MTIDTTSLPGGRFFGPANNAEPLPCRSCGVIVRRPDPTRAETISIPLQNFGRGPTRVLQIDVIRCDECTDRRALAARLLVEHPRVAREHGSVGLHRLDVSLGALDVVGIRGAKAVAGYVADDQTLRDTIEALASVGAAASWSARPTEADKRGRWDDITSDHRQEITHALKALTLRRLERPMPFAPPSVGKELLGCGFCGLGALLVKESRARDAWGPTYRIPPAVVGGSGPDTMTAYLCPECRIAVHKEGNAVGMPAVERSLLASRGFEARRAWGVQLPGIKAFAALRPGTAPNATRWAHIPAEHLARLDRDLSVSIYVRKLGAEQ